MNDRNAAERAAKDLARELRLPSWKGSVFVWLADSDFVLKIFADRAWLAAHREIPSAFNGFRVEVEDRIVGEPHAFKATKYA